MKQPAEWREKAALYSEKARATEDSTSENNLPSWQFDISRWRRSLKTGWWLQPS